jgi:dihydrolipoamide dehydrogenase
MGSGAVGVEFASIYRRFGSEVTIIELLPRAGTGGGRGRLGRAREVVQEAGIAVMTGTKVTKAVAGARAWTSRRRRRRRDEEAVGRAAAGRDRPWPGDHGLGAEESAWRWSAATSRWTSSIARRCPNISAIGDVVTLGNGSVHPQLAHVSSAEGILVAERIAGLEVKPLNFDHVPGCTYCDPEIGSVGLTEAEAKKRGYEVRDRLVPVRRARPREDGGEPEGFVKIVADKQYDEVLGVHMIGPRSTELVAEAVLALRLECTVEELIKTIHAHPTFRRQWGEPPCDHGAAIHL